METIIIFGLLAGLDNLQVAPAIGMMRMSMARRCLFALAFGAFEALMPLVGLLIGNFVHQSFISASNLAGPFILIACGLLVIWLAIQEKDTSEFMSSRWVIIGLPLSLSFDNLFAGVGLGSVGYGILVPALVIGTISVAMSLFGLFFGRWISKWIPDKAELISGAYLVVLAVIKLLDR